MKKKLNNFDTYSYMGKIEKVVGMTIEASINNCNIGDICHISINGHDECMMSEVVGFKDEKALLMPYGDIDGIGRGNYVKNTNARLKIKVSDAMIGRTVDALGNPIDGLGEILTEKFYDIKGKPSNPMERPRIDEVVELGVKAIDGLLTIGKGQRMGIFAGSGVGKSTLMGMIARNVKVDVNVIALVGERGREVIEFIKRDLGEEGLRRSVLVIATSDQPAMMREKCALTASTIAEYFKDKGNDVLLMMDSLTRYAMAQREIGLSIGEPPIARGYTPSIYTTMPRLLERAGRFKEGSITGIYTVLVEGDDANEPISDTVRGIIDGHIMLSRKVAAKNHYPAIDILSSVSRLMNDIAEPLHKENANKLRNLMSTYEENIDLVSIGAYKKGANKELDEAMAKIDNINDFLMQSVDESFSFDDTVKNLAKSIGN